MARIAAAVSHKKTAIAPGALNRLHSDPLRRYIAGMKTALLLALLLVGASVSAATSSLRKEVEADYPYLETLYMALHQSPELSFHEKETANRMAAELEKLGYAVTRNVGGHGVVGVLKNGEGPTLLIRADMDALPVEEKTGLEYASRVRTTDDEGNDVPVMHACGHDMHMTVFTGTARRLASMKDKWRGTLVMITQPAEERAGGARAMIRDGLFERFPRPDYNLGLHVNADLPAGSIGYTEGPALANVDMVDITVYGIGGHGAYPHTTKDPIVLAAQIINNLQTLVSREISPLEPGVVTVGSIHGGTKHNIIPDQVHLQLTVRSYSDETREKLINGIERIAVSQARTAGLGDDKLPKIAVRDETTPAVVNDPTLARRVAAVFRETLGGDRVSQIQPVMGGEDFAEYGRVEPRIPSFFFWIGAVDPEKYRHTQTGGASLPSLHSPFFAPLPGPTIKTGVEAMTAAALDLFNNRNPP